VATSLGELFIVDRAVMRPLKPKTGVWIGLADHGITVVPA
jgi:hypothetical protein